MSDKFNGFSQDEINKVSGVRKATSTLTTTKAATEAHIKQAFRGQHTGLRRMPEKWSKTSTAATTEQLRKQQVTQKPQITTLMPTNSMTNGTKADAGIANKQLKIQNMPQTQNDLIDDINIDDSLSKSLENVLFYQPLKKPTAKTENIDAYKTTTTTTTTAAAAATNANVKTRSAADDSSILKLPISNDDSMMCSSSDDSSILPMPRTLTEANNGFTTPTNLPLESPFKGISLKDFETHRKMIQEQNKQKKDILYKAIEHHSKKTAAEARKIEDIKTELAKLDNDLAIDVAILRKQIDNACVHFANVEKQYMKVEAQFLKAKLDLHNAAEKKELLTEHLYTVIAHNEDRKAQKLTELMQKVGLTPSGDYEIAPSEQTPAQTPAPTDRE